jgi:hypothetical protein
MSSDKVLYVNPETKDVIATGNVGIGTTQPLAKLHVEGAILSKGVSSTIPSNYVGEIKTIDFQVVISNATVADIGSFTLTVGSWLVMIMGSTTNSNNATFEGNVAFAYDTNNTFEPYPYATHLGRGAFIAYKTVPGTYYNNATSSSSDLISISTNTTYYLRYKLSPSITNSIGLYIKVRALRYI